MKLQKKGLLSDCEHLLTPLTTDQEGNLRGGFGDFGGISTCGANRSCKNRGCKTICVIMFIATMKYAQMLNV